MFEYLTEKEKAEWKKGFEIAIADGEVDLEIIPYLFRINLINGIVTTQSCKGHDDCRDGYISFRLSRARGTGKRYEHFISNLVRNKNVFNVETDYEQISKMIKPRTVIRYEPENMDDVLTQVIWLLR